MSTNSRLLKKMCDVAGVQYSLIQIMDWEGPGNSSVNTDKEISEGDHNWVVSTSNLVRIETNFDTQFLNVWFELWDGPPVELDFEESAIETDVWVGILESTSGKLSAVEITDPRESPPVFDLGKEGIRWNMRVILRTLVEEEPDEWNDHEEAEPLLSDELEEIILQFWE
ncbi:hypothetical protein GCM10010466_39060 [Planomonospora alba]|uniref:Uncharacterized protein n=1 Tax=Planomonospora alba TaxID=161354 RepID=A0ABP6NCX7_9ACTN